MRRLSSKSKERGVRFFAVIFHESPPKFSTPAPMLSSNFRISRTSLISGRLCKIIGSSLSKVAANIGKAAFLFPAGVTSPLSGIPPSIRNFSIDTPLN